MQTYEINEAKFIILLQSSYFIMTFNFIVAQRLILDLSSILILESTIIYRLWYVAIPMGITFTRPPKLCVRKRKLLYIHVNILTANEGEYERVALVSLNMKCLL